MEEVVEWKTNMKDQRTGLEKTAQAEEQMRNTSPALRFGLLNGVGNITELCKRQTKTNKTYSSSAVSDATPVVGHVGLTEFMNASSQGDLKVIDQYLSDGGNPDVHDELKRTALHLASMEGNSAVVQMLLDRGADINFKDRLGSRALHWACRGGNLEVVKVLKSHGADLDVGDKEGDTALHDAVRLNRYKIVKMLIVAGADTTMQNHEGLTAVQQVKKWQFDIMETLQRLEKQKEVGHVPPQTPPERNLTSSP
ncbi:ankyrin repeat domain-containing protein 2 isoform X3 [Sphaeramia orbicularis]|uniref:ankyrin repeat domain-containing protein 2 isoform X3 n=1 Tax=Sphaeramia orbicularis TaxID=375764 RepID=UPI00117EC4DD|nr:ankyrin repeat domain-containing protein 2 isoform X3 [Sphaeramia orbicularis]